MAARIFFAFALSTSAFAQTQTTNIPTLTPLTPAPPAIVTQPSPAPAPAPVPVPAPAPQAPPPPAEPSLVWDASEKTYEAKVGEATAPFVFSFTNVSSGEVIITNLQTSCGCTAAQMPETPWHLPAGTNGEIKVTMNLAGKQGNVTKQVTVNTSHGVKALLVHVIIPPAPTPVTNAAENLRGDRNANMELAKADRQAVFKGDCRSCHVDPGVGKHGKELYDADCGVCHDSHIRAAMVPDLRAPKTARDKDYWVNWITYGRPGSMMPAFGEKDGGPLAKEQIDSLVAYLVKEFPQAPVAVPAPVKVVPAANPTPGAGQ
ncbi:MAG: DUF1573 domain-containing protein [Verrucomicrobiota bacterium]